ncbi:hypothetical protein [Paractinoplanes durhamensis]|uniref:Uncharacterized protein n=1 Tax=Paractinoplanes durhamensis TaxID=113563 RepID=A0ABQ3ZE40_9ACTN|nr:hypothetical protein [Actinoplanes durhamensis]GIE08071.1 hypothetical protein Adu01nite_94210 [Actinoplanes durhamensis]
MDKIMGALTYESISMDWHHPLVTFLAEGNVDHAAGQLQLLILVVFAILFLLLSQVRELMRQIAHTIEEWQRLRRSMRRDASHPPTEPLSTEDADRPHHGTGENHETR